MIAFGIGFITGIVTILVIAYLCNRYVIKKEDEMFLQQYKESLTNGK